MIGLVATLVEALALHDYLLFVGALAVFIPSLKSRDLGLVAYFIYTLYFTQRVDVTSLYSYSGLTRALTLSLAMLLLLEDVLRGKLRAGRKEIVPSILTLLGIFTPEAVIAGGLLYLTVRIPSAWGVLFAGIATGMVALLKGTLVSLGTSGQVATVSAVTLGAIAVLYMLKGPESRPMLENDREV